MVKKIKEEETYSTDFSFAESYIEDLRFPKYVPIKVKFPLSDDRKAANINYLDDYWRRSFRGKIPFEYHSYTNLKKQPPKNFSSAENLFINKAPNTKNVPEGYYATSSGNFPIDFIPFQDGEPIDYPAYVDGETESTLSGQFILLKNLPYKGINDTYRYSYNPSIGRFFWDIKPEFQNPIEPELRFPNGAIKRKDFK